MKDPDMTMVEEVGQKIRASIKFARTQGFQIKPNMMRVRHHPEGPRCCAIGAVVLDVDPADRNLYTTACERLSIGMGEVISIVNAFDGNAFWPHNSEKWFGLGQTIRQEVIEGTL